MHSLLGMRSVGIILEGYFSLCSGEGGHMEWAWVMGPIDLYGPVHITAEVVA